MIAFDLDWNHTPEELGRRLNAALPADVAVKYGTGGCEDFHPRFDASAELTGTDHCQPERDPLASVMPGGFGPQVDLELLQKAARLLIGAHDFAAFGIALRAGGSTIRTVLAAGWDLQAGSAV